MLVTIGSVPSLGSGVVGNEELDVTMSVEDSD